MVGAARAIEAARAGAALEPIFADLSSLSETRGMAAALDARAPIG